MEKRLQWATDGIWVGNPEGRKTVRQCSTFVWQIFAHYCTTHAKNAVESVKCRAFLSTEPRTRMHPTEFFTQQNMPWQKENFRNNARSRNIVSRKRISAKYNSDILAHKFCWQEKSWFHWSIYCVEVKGPSAAYSKEGEIHIVQSLF